MSVKLNQDSNLKIIFSVTLMAVLGVSSVTPAFPLIKNEFSLRSEQVGYLITFFTLPGIFLTPVLGILADRFGRKKILIPSLLIFGMGHGTNFPVIQVMLTRAVPFEFRAAFMSMNGTILRLGQSSGPVIMGLLFPLITIHGIFISGAIVAIITGLTIWFGVAKNFGNDSHKSNSE